MFFTSSEFIFLFLPLALLGYYGLGKINVRFAAAWLAFTSVVYYGWFKPEYVVLLLASMAFNYTVSLAMARAAAIPVRQAWLIFGICANLLLLFVFKYLSPILGFLHSQGLTSTDHGTIALPIGISFFTFTQIAYLVDSQQGVAYEKNFTNYAVFVTFFPHIVAGPILHHKEMMPQFAHAGTYEMKTRNLVVGLSLFAMGFLKKMLIADQARYFADAAFSAPHGLQVVTAWFGVLFYTLQIYFDFSGYSDMAIGLARLFGVRFPMNFNSPLKAKNMIEFWQRWHITLTRYLTLYVYNPLALWVARRRAAAGKPANRSATATLGGFLPLIAFPTLVTMLSSGAWHGAGLQFVAWGALYAVYLMLNHAWHSYNYRRTRSARTALVIPPLPARALTFLAVLSAMVLFRSNSLHDAVTFYQSMLGMHGWSAHLGASSLFQVVFATVLCGIVWLTPNTQEILARYEPILETRSIRPAAVSAWLARSDLAGTTLRAGIAGISVAAVVLVLLSVSSGAKPFVYAFF